MPFLLLKLLGIGKWLKEAATALLGVIGRYPWQTALIAALCLAGWQYRGKQHALADLAAERLAHAETIKAGQQAYAAQVALHAKDLATFKAAKKDTDDAHQPKLAAALDSTSRFAADNGLRKACARIIPTSSPAEGPVAQGDNGPDLPTDLVVVPAADLKICTTNTLRLEAVRDWGIALKDAGLGE
jgi:hypothetical protein